MLTRFPTDVVISDFETNQARGLSFSVKQALNARVSSLRPARSCVLSWQRRSPTMMRAFACLVIATVAGPAKTKRLSFCTPPRAILSRDHKDDIAPSRAQMSTAETRPHQPAVTFFRYSLSKTLSSNFHLRPMMVQIGHLIIDYCDAAPGELVGHIELESRRGNPLKFGKEMFIDDRLRYDDYFDTLGGVSVHTAKQLRNEDSKHPVVQSFTGCTLRLGEFAAAGIREISITTETLSSVPITIRYGIVDPIAEYIFAYPGSSRIFIKSQHSRHGDDLFVADSDGRITHRSKICHVVRGYRYKEDSCLFIAVKRKNGRLLLYRVHFPIGGKMEVKRLKHADDGSSTALDDYRLYAAIRYHDMVIISDGVHVLAVTIGQTAYHVQRFRLEDPRSFPVTVRPGAYRLCVHGDRLFLFSYGQPQNGTYRTDITWFSLRGISEHPGVL